MSITGSENKDPMKSKCVFCLIKNIKILSLAVDEEKIFKYFISITSFFKPTTEILNSYKLKISQITSSRLSIDKIIVPISIFCSAKSVGQNTKAIQTKL